MDKNLIDGLHRQFKSSFRMIRNAIQSVPQERWHVEVQGWYYSLSVYHIIETIDFYLRDNPDGMEWGKKAGYVWHKSIDIKSEILPKITKDVVNEYLTEMETSVSTFFESANIEKLGMKDDFKWFSSRFERLIYLLRHNMHHIGELCMALRMWNCDRVKWE